MGQYLSAPIVDKSTDEGTIVLNKSLLKLIYGVSAHQGWRKSMEDAHLVHVHEEICLFGVFDGHGGAEVAKFAARHLPVELCTSSTFQEGKYTEALIDSFHRVDELLPHSLDELVQLKQLEAEADAENEDTFDVLRRLLVMQRMAGKGGQEGDEEPIAEGQEIKAKGLQKAEKAPINAGCTAVVALLAGKELYVANAGDSRAIVSRNGKAIAMSEDHKPSNASERERIVAAGGFLSDFGGICRVNGNLALSRALGDLSYKQNSELHPREQIITAEPDVERMTLTEDDQFMVIACDGIFDVKTNQEVVDFVKSKLDAGKSPTDVASDLLNACVASDPRESRGIGADNMTCAIIVFHHNHTE